MNSVDLTGLKVITLSDVEAAGKAGSKEVVVCPDCLLTPSARDFVEHSGIALRVAGIQGSGAASGSSSAAASAHERLFFSPEAEKAKAEICAVGKKLWQRAYVDGNGGNISHRIGPNEVICTPTLISKADLTPADMCLVDLEGNQLAGLRPRTSEILLHLEIYKAVPEAKGVVHCHPPHATAYAITGRIPPTCVIPEAEVFIGRVAISPYETPGTTKFAQTVLPYVKQHNTVLLANHGIVCWADTVTHAEWYAEVVDTYCWTLMLAAQLDTPVSHISSEKASDLLAIKQRLGLPDVRLGSTQCPICDIPDKPGSIVVTPGTCAISDSGATKAEIDAIVQSVTDAVMAALAKQKA